MAQQHLAGDPAQRYCPGGGEHPTRGPRRSQQVKGGGNAEPSGGRRRLPGHRQGGRQRDEADACCDAASGEPGGASQQ